MELLQQGLQLLLRESLVTLLNEDMQLDQLAGHRIQNHDLFHLLQIVGLQRAQSPGQRRVAAHCGPLVGTLQVLLQLEGDGGQVLGRLVLLRLPEVGEDLVVCEQLLLCLQHFHPGPMNDGVDDEKRRAVAEKEKQRAAIEALMARPARPAKPAREETREEESKSNGQGSSAGAGSGDFHAYKAARRREQERVDAMATEAAQVERQAVFEAQRQRLQQEDERRTASKRRERQRKRRPNRKRNMEEM